MITKLTGEIENIIEKVSRRWMFNSFWIRDFNEDIIEQYLFRMYSLYGLSRPKIIYAASPLECQKIAIEMRDPGNSPGQSIMGINWHREMESLFPTDRLSKKVSHYVSDNAVKSSYLALQIESDMQDQFGDYAAMFPFSVHGIRAAQWCCFYDILRELLHLKYRDFELHLEFILQSGIFVSIYTPSTVIISPNPALARFNEKGDIHCSEGPAIAWEDDYKLYFLNGVRMYFDPADKLDPSLLLKERNAEARKEIVERVGIKNIIESLGASVIDKWGDYELLAVEVPLMGIRPTYLSMQNASTGDRHFEGIPPEVKSCREALAWRDGEGTYIIPEQLT